MAGDGGVAIALAAEAHRKFLIETAVVTQSNSQFLEDARSLAFTSESTVHEPMAGPKTIDTQTKKDGVVSERTSLKFNQPLMSHDSADLVSSTAQGEIKEKSHVNFYTPFWGSDHFKSKAVNSADGLLYSTEGTFTRSVTKPDEVDTVTRDGSGKIIQTSHAVINTPLSGAMTIDIEYKNSDGKKIGTSHSDFDNPLLDDMRIKTNFVRPES